MSGGGRHGTTSSSASAAQQGTVGCVKRAAARLIQFLQQFARDLLAHILKQTIVTGEQASITGEHAQEG
jgi:hypothetical protein